MLVYTTSTKKHITILTCLDLNNGLETTNPSIPLRWRKISESLT